MSGADEFSYAELARAHFVSALVLLKCSPLVESTFDAARAALNAGSQQLGAMPPDTVSGEELLELCQLEKRVRAVLTHASQLYQSV